MEQRVSLITLGVRDLAEAERFYKALGWQRGNAEEGVAFYQMPGAVLGLWSRAEMAAEAGLADKGGFGGIALAYNARSREEVDSVLAEAVAAGAKLLKPAADTFWGGYSGYFADPDGHPWEVAFNPGWRIDEAGAIHLSG